MGGIILIGLLCVGLFALGQNVRSHVGTLLLGSVLVGVAVHYWTRPAPVVPDETNVLPGAALVAVALAFGAYALGVLRGQRSP